MDFLHDKNLVTDKYLRACAVGVIRRGETRANAEEHLAELEELLSTYGVPTAEKIIANAEKTTAAFLVGSGKVEEVRERAEAMECEVIVVDDDLTPLQQRNWERVTKLAVIDRQEVILGIFADRARTKEAQLQVELARARYSLPRLQRAWTHLERQRGGRGFKGGSGEAQLETDRRLVRNRITQLRRDLEHVRQVRATQRKSREYHEVPTVSLVGYTNAGKSSLMRCLTGADVLVEDKLFATLDPTTRRIHLDAGREVLLTDTVGFIRKLPHGLVEAFKATLEEAQLADLLVHVIDSSHPQWHEHLEAADAVLEELEALDKPTVFALNKADLLQDRSTFARFREKHEACVFTSAVTGEGIEDLQRMLHKMLPQLRQRLSLRVPAGRGDVLSWLHREGQVLRTEYDGGDALLDVMLPRALAERAAQWAAPEAVSGTA
ncbi:MAG: GTPase HflX [Candidatus Sumerlaeia bacterium]|nr:GTPase HflX [Candidatus Sumerlaeia bacterium]